MGLAGPKLKAGVGSVFLVAATLVKSKAAVLASLGALEPLDFFPSAEEPGALREDFLCWSSLGAPSMDRSLAVPRSSVVM